LIASASLDAACKAAITIDWSNAVFGGRTSMRVAQLKLHALVNEHICVDSQMRASLFCRRYPL